jgi:hypothetical protein
VPPRPVWTPPFALTVSVLFDVLLELDDELVVVVGAGGLVLLTAGSGIAPVRRRSES